MRNHVYADQLKNGDCGFRAKAAIPAEAEHFSGTPEWRSPMPASGLTTGSAGQNYRQEMLPTQREDRLPARRLAMRTIKEVYD
jgi:hypothetical protein